LASGLVSDIQRFCTHDGPGIRTTVFLKGCPLDCFWCHNPESKSFAPGLLYTAHLCIACGYCVECCPEHAHSIFNDEHHFDRTRCRECLACAGECYTGALEQVGREMTAAQVVAVAEKDRAFYEESGGGLTLSGGEPAAQPEFALEICHLAKAAGISVCIETCGFGPAERFFSLAPHVDLFLWDLKDTDEARHLASTGAVLAPILENLRRVDRAGGTTVLRCVLIPDVNLNQQHLDGVAAVFRSLANCGGIELLAYHPLGASKLERLGIECTRPLPAACAPDELVSAANYLRGLVGESGVIER
jgi:pyruvate formate lyase activating enzyme